MRRGKYVLEASQLDRSLPAEAAVHTSWNIALGSQASQPLRPLSERTCRRIKGLCSDVPLSAVSRCSGGLRAAPWNSLDDSVGVRVDRWYLPASHATR